MRSYHYTIPKSKTELTARFSQLSFFKVTNFNEITKGVS